jgi:hypothetical protein
VIAAISNGVLLTILIVLAIIVCVLIIAGRR